MHKEAKGRKGSKYSRMSQRELLDYCKRLYEAGGIEALSYTALKNIKSLYPNLYRVGLPQKKLIAMLGLADEYAKYLVTAPLVRSKGPTTRWTWARCIREARAVKEQFSSLPPGGWFQANGQGSIVQAVYNLGKSWELLRQEVGDFESSSFVESRNGLRWRSHPEASFSNFLYARGVTHKRGEKYPDDYADHSSARYAYYDVHFLSRSGIWINVEIWGDKPHGHGESRYAEKRTSKENYHSDRDDFLGVPFQDCFSDEKLCEILSPYLGVIEPFQFDKPTDKHIEASHWSNADELLVACRKLAESMPDGRFPTEEWLRKRGKWSDREGVSFNTMSVYIKAWIGGVRNLRRLIGQTENSTEVWNREKAIDAYKEFYEEYGLTPEQYRHMTRNENLEMCTNIAKKASKICAAVLKYAGGSASVNELLGIEIDRTRRWTKEAIIDGYRKVIEEWKISPNQLLSDHRSSKVTLDDQYAADIQRLLGATSGKFPGGARDVYSILNFKLPSRSRKRRVRI